jgi:DNA-binding LacI/PurR family transcriptional regulator
MAGDRPTLDTVARAAGVSRMTVSNAYNRPDQLSPQTRKRVLDAAAELGYPGPDPTAASLRLRRTGTIGVVLTEQLPYAFADPGLVMILHGIASELSDSGTALLLVPGHTAGGQSPLRTALVDAVVLCSVSAADPAVTAAQERQVPIVTVGTPRLPHVPRVGPDNRRPAAELAQHLLGLGHRRLAVLTTVHDEGSGTARPIFAARVDGFRDAVRASGADVQVICAGDNNRTAGQGAAADLLNRPRRDRPTAIFAVTDILALGVLDAAAASRVRVPRELSVAGFDNIAAAATSAPPLTTVEHDLFGQGRAAARLARRLIAGEAVRPPRVDVELVVRKSTGPAPS